MSDHNPAAAGPGGRLQLAVDSEDFRKHMRVIAFHSTNLPGDPDEVQNALWEACNGLREFGFPSRDGEDPPLAEAISNGIGDALDTFPDNMGVAIEAGKLLVKMAEMRRLDKNLYVMHNTQAALGLHGDNFRVQQLYREALWQSGQLRLGMADLTKLKHEMKQAAAYMQRPTWVEGNALQPVAAQEIIKCLTLMNAHGIFAQMSGYEQERYMIPVAQFGVWSLTESVRQDSLASTCYLDKHVGLEACDLLYRVAAGCMQQTSQMLVEKHRKWLCACDLHQLLFEFRQHLSAIGHSCERTQWLFERLTPDSAAPAQRAAGGSA